MAKIGSVAGDGGDGEVAEIKQIGERRKVHGYYVYAHCQPDGTPFYIGKGTGRRAWSADRDHLWHHFIMTRCGGSYKVVIIEEGLGEDQALELEEELIAAHGERLVNWINPGRQFDYAAIERFHAMRDSTTSFISETRLLEVSDPEAAVARYRLALDQVNAYARMETEKGLVADLQRELGRHYADISPLDRLTLVLRRLGRFAEIVEAVDAYFELYPNSASSNHAVHKRRGEACAILAGLKAPSASKPTESRQLKIGLVPDVELSPLLRKARRGRAPWDWMLAARLCRRHGDLAREQSVLEEFLQGPRVPGRTWLELERRLFIVRGMIAEQSE